MDSDDEHLDDWLCALCGGPFRRVPDGEETRWALEMYVLGYNRAVSGPTRSFLARGSFANQGKIRVYLWPPESRDPNSQGLQGQPNVFICDQYYQDFDYGAFPMHLSCLELFSFCLTGRQGLNLQNLGLDKEALYLALWTLNEESTADLARALCPATLGRGGWWQTFRRRHDFLIAYPGLPDPITVVTPNPVTSDPRALLSCRDVIIITSSRNLILPEAAAAISSRVKADPFCQLPLELLHKITDVLDDSGLFRLCRASWVVHSAIRADRQFWRRRIMPISMPWLPEVVPLLDDKELMAKMDIKGFLCGLTRLTKDWYIRKGPWWSVINRRRIWSVCEVVGQEYVKELEARKRRVVCKRCQGIQNQDSSSDSSEGDEEEEEKDDDDEILVD